MSLGYPNLDAIENTLVSDREDVANVARVQRGLRAEGLDAVTLTANDVRIRWLHDDLARYMSGEA